MLTLDPKWGIAPECQLNREIISNFVTHCINLLTKPDCPYIGTTMAQQLCLSEPQLRRQLILTHRNLINEKLESLRDEILEYKILEDKKQTKQRLFKKMILYIILFSGMGNPTDSMISKEVCYALSSVFDEDDTLKFLELNRFSRKSELEYLTKLVIGIRVFNEKCGKTDSGILQCK